MSKDNSIRRNNPVFNCIFCDGLNPTSEEHILPAWVYRTLDKAGIFYDQHYVFSNISMNGRENYFDFVQTDDATTPILCTECNNHWGSDIQNDAASVLKPFILGGWIQLSDKQRFKLIKWFTSYVMVREMLHDEKNFHSQSERMAFRNDSTIPSTLNIWLAPIEQSDISSIHRLIQHRALMYRTEAEKGDTPNVHITIQTIGKIILVGFSGAAYGSFHPGTIGFYAISKFMLLRGFIPLLSSPVIFENNFPSMKPSPVSYGSVIELCQRITDVLNDPVEFVSAQWSV